MATSKTEVVNIALTHIGASLITSIDDVTKSAVLAKANWDSNRDFVLRAAMPKCCRKRRDLTPESATPDAEEWSYQFLLPPDCVRVIGCNVRPFAIEGRKLLCNSDSVQIKYIFRNEDTASWDEMLVQAVAARMAHLLAYPLVQSAALRDSMLETYRIYAKEARSVDAQEADNQDLEANDWLEARV